MSAKHFYYLNDKNFNSDALIPLSNREEENNDNEYKEDDFEFMQEVPYSSDRSSIGSIPWADDAIKQNQQDWECVERMLSGEDSLPEEEPELRNEILEWQLMFPQLLRKNVVLLKKQQSEESTKSNIDYSQDIDSFSYLSLDSLEADNNYDEPDSYDDLATPTKTQNNHQLANHKTLRAPTTKLNEEIIDLANIFDTDFRINSVPLTLRQRSRLRTQNVTHQNSSDSSTSSTSLLMSRKTIKPLNNALLSPIKKIQTNSAIETNTRIPPIFNVLETKKRFRGLTNNRSFVQLTQIQQVKSAHQPKQIRTAGLQSTWQVPLAMTSVGNRFLNNRNSIVLPSINSQRSQFKKMSISTNTTNTTNKSTEPHPRSVSNSSSGDITQRDHFFMPQRNNYNERKFSTTSSTSGRSISAAVHHPRMGISAFYVPYSAYKFKAFK